MKLIIDIPENVYKASQIIEVKHEDVVQIPLEVIAKGTPLPKIDKPYIKGDYYDGFKNGLRTAKWRYDKIKAEIEELDKKYVIGDYTTYGEHSPKYIQLMEVLQIIEKYNAESEVSDASLN